MLYTLLAALFLVGLAVVGLAIRIIVLKGGRFPVTHVGQNIEMRKRGLVCAKTFDRIEQNNAKKPVDLTSLRVDKRVKQ